MPISQEKIARAEKLLQDIVPNIADCVAKYAQEKPNATALIEHNTGEKITWQAFDMAVSAFAAKLLSMGLKKGDIIATSLPLLKEHVYLMYACYRIGVILAPLDLRLKVAEIQYAMGKIEPKAYFFLGKTLMADFRPMVEEVMKTTPSITTWVQVQKEADLVMEGAVGLAEFAKDIPEIFMKSLETGVVQKARELVDRRDPCLIIFTTGSTGSPKPALLCHENILVQNVALGVAFEMDESSRMLVNLPPSHVGCTTELLQTPLFMGATPVILHIFDPKLSLEAVQEHKITHLGQIPALFNMEWRLPDYDSYDLSSIKMAIYGGQAVSRQFLEKMQTMAPEIATGLGLTETGGFCTYTDIPSTVDDIMKGIGYAMPFFPISIRGMMKKDGSAGDEKPAGEVGEICFQGPQVFLGYLGDPENTAKTISSDGIVYTGDLGYYDDEGLHFAGRGKMVIKPKGYQVFPGDVENHIEHSFKGRLGTVAVVGAEHDVFTEGIIAFVEVPDGENITADDINEACKQISAYSRPSHIEVVKVGEIPLNRVAKTDYVTLKEQAKAIVERLRSEGKWDK